MQFPRHCVAPSVHIAGIATFVDTVENSFNRIACETAASALAACVPRRARGSAIAGAGPLIRAWAAPPTRISRGWRACYGLTRMFSGSRAIHQVRRRCAHNADRLAHDAPLSAFVTEVVCTVGGAAPRRDLTTPNRDLTAPNRGLTDSKRGESRCTGTRA